MGFMSVGFAFHENILLSAWSTAATVEEVAELHARAAALSARRGGGIGLILLVLEGVGPSPREARERAQEMLRGLGDHVEFVAVIVRGEGFGMAAVRAMFTGMAFAVRPRFSWRVCGRAIDLVGWAPLDELRGPDGVIGVERALKRLEAEVLREREVNVA